MKEADSARQAVLEEFRATAKERLERVNNDWVTLETDPSNQEAAADALRELHSLKGESKMMGFADISLVAHRTEELVIWARKHDFDVADDVGDVVLACVDTMGELLEKRIGGSEQTADLGALMSQVDGLLRGGTGASEAQEPQASPAAGGETRSAAEGLEKRVAADNTLRVDVAAVSAFSESVSESVVAHARYEHWASRLKIVCVQVEDDLARLGILKGTALHTGTDAGATGVDARIGQRAIQVLSRFHADVQNIAEGHGQDVHDGALAARELDHRATRLRQVPIGTLLRSYIRPVRDLAHENGKLAMCEVDDGGVSLDKNVADRLAEPLLHIIRNGVDHGIERPSERTQRGKPKEGRVRLAASQSGGYTTVTVEDDGSGIGVDVVRRRAVELGAMSSAASESLSEDDAFALLFQPGFSTRQTVTEVSGRGVGLDVVKRQLEVMGGTVRLRSTPGEGTRFDLRVPTTVALTRVFIVRLADQAFAIPVASIGTVMLLAQARVETVHDHRSVRFKGRPVRMADLTQILGFSGEAEPDRVVVVTHEGRGAALLVPEWSGDGEVVVKPLEKLLRRARVVNGACVLEGGEVALVLDPAQLIARAEGKLVSVASPQQGPSSSRVTFRILIAEDSAITRQMVSRLLTTLGYEVVQACDGVQALGVVRSESVDLLLTDIDMPNMTGFELIKEVRAIAEQRNLPIIVMSTRGDDADKRAAIEAGADAYLVKTEFSESTLRDVIARRLG